MLIRLICVFGPGLLLAGTGAGSAQAAGARELEGKYKIKGYANGKFDCEQTATIVFKKGNTIEVTLKDGKETWIGLGKLEGTHLKINALKTTGKGRQTWEYDVQKNGCLECEWKEGRKRWKEVWFKQK